MVVPVVVIVPVVMSVVVTVHRFPRQVQMEMDVGAHPSRGVLLQLPMLLRRMLVPGRL